MHHPAFYATAPPCGLFSPTALWRYWHIKDNQHQDTPVEYIIAPHFDGNNRSYRSKHYYKAIMTKIVRITFLLRKRDDITHEEFHK
jgi:hypothetical protein